MTSRVSAGACSPGSAAAAEAGDLANALSRAHAASSLAGTEDLSAIRMWALWQVGRVSLAAGDSEGALSAFCRRRFGGRGS